MTKTASDDLITNEELAHMAKEEASVLALQTGLESPKRALDPSDEGHAETEVQACKPI
jgi:hypothetical protein